MGVKDTVNGSERSREREVDREEPADNVTINPETLKRLGIVGLIALGAFLLGFVPMWLSSEGYESEVKKLTTTLRPSVLQNNLATATINARRGEFEQALQETSGFFTDLRAELERSESAFANEQQQSVRSMLEQRDETITMLARSDPAGADRLTELYFKFIQVKNSAVPESKTAEAVR